MIISIGFDITQIPRVKAVYEKYTDRFVHRILAPEEQESYHRRANKIAYLAKRFAVKEATAKALGTGMKAGVSWRQIAAINKPSGEPYLLLRGAALERMQSLGAKRALVTISDDGLYAMAFVIFTDEGELRTIELNGIGTSKREP